MLRGTIKLVEDDGHNVHISVRPSQRRSRGFIVAFIAPREVWRSAQSTLINLAPAIVQTAHRATSSTFPQQESLRLINIAMSLTDDLQLPEAYPHPVGKIEFAQTHISLVFLTGEFAYKLKKPIKLSFLDFSTLE